MTIAAAVLDTYRPADERLRDDLGLYCRNLVKIADKDGQLRPFVWNESQAELHRQLERQRESQGWVRALVLKARQLGISTYTGARYYHHTTLWPGRKTYILTHEDKATQNLFSMVKRTHDHMPGDYKLRATASNANEMVFGAIDGGYRVGTAKNVAGGGRSQTIHLFHGSEVAFWPHAETHFSGVMQGVPTRPGTEVILESTANGVGGLFYDRWAQAEAGRSDFTPVFLPWFWAHEYRRPLDRTFSPSLEEEGYAELYKLDDEQLCWLHFKNIELGGDPGAICGMFRQEYPAVAAEAFQATGEDSFISGELVMAARRNVVPDQDHMPRVIGVDVARGGKDRTRIIDRQGRSAGRLVNVTIDIDDEKILADKIGIMLQRRPDIRRCYIDTTGVGGGCYDILKNAGFERIVVAVNFGAGATEPERYRNKRAEIWGRMKDWFADPVGVSIPDDDSLHRHICGPGFRWTGGMDGRQVTLEPKEEIKKRLGFSPDGGDALALTFAETQIPIDTEEKQPWWKEHVTGGRTDWMTA